VIRPISGERKADIAGDIRQLLDVLAAAEEDHQDLLVDKIKEEKKTAALLQDNNSRH
jgi:hypothetical protein